VAVNDQGFAVLLLELRRLGRDIDGGGSRSGRHTRKGLPFSAESPLTLAFVRIASG
jgi:hypothetical protein